MKQIDSVGSIPVRVKKNLLRVLKDRVCCPVSVQKQVPIGTSDQTSHFEAQLSMSHVEPRDYFKDPTTTKARPGSSLSRKRLDCPGSCRFLTLVPTPFQIRFTGLNPPRPTVLGSVCPVVRVQRTRSLPQDVRDKWNVTSLYDSFGPVSLAWTLSLSRRKLGPTGCEVE